MQNAVSHYGAKHCQEMLCYAAGLQDSLLLEQSAYEEVQGSRETGGLLGTPEGLRTAVASGIASSAWPSVPCAWEMKKQQRTKTKLESLSHLKRLMELSL